MSINKVILIGRVGKDVDIRYMTSGDAVCNLSLATSEQWKDKAGEKKEKTEWHNLVFYGRLAEIVGEYVTKGQEIFVEGKLQTRKWQDKDGNDRYTTEVACREMQMLGGKRDGGSSSSESSRGSEKQSARDDDFEQDIPF